MCQIYLYDLFLTLTQPAHFPMVDCGSDLQQAGESSDKMAPDDSGGEITMCDLCYSETEQEASGLPSSFVS